MKRAMFGLMSCCAAWAAAGQDLKASGGSALAAVALTGARLTARPLGDCARVSLTAKGPGDFWERDAQSCARGASLELGTAERPVQPGTYTYEVRLLAAPDAPAADDRPRVAWGRFQIDAQGELVPPQAAPGARQPEADLTIADATPQLVFNDTDASATDWQIHTVSDGAVLAAQNMAGGNSPLVLESAAPENSLVVSSSGIGIGTAAPNAHIHVVEPVPVLRLDSTSTSHDWVVTAAEALGFAEVATSSPIVKIRGGAPGRALQIDSTGNIAAFADDQSSSDAALASLHVKRTNGTAKLLVEEAGATTASRNMLQIKNNGASTFRFDNTASGQLWGFGALGSGNFFVGSVPGQPLGMTLTPAGNLSITGTLSQGSDRESKTDIEAADARAVLAKVAELPVSTWRYKGDEARHVGPMAQDFAALFGLGTDDKHIAPGDMAGLALAAIQALREDALRQRGEAQAREAEKDARIGELEARLRALEQREERR